MYYRCVDYMKYWECKNTLHQSMSFPQRYITLPQRHKNQLPRSCPRTAYYLMEPRTWLLHQALRIGTELSGSTPAGIELHVHDRLSRETSHMAIVGPCGESKRHARPSTDRRTRAEIPRDSKALRHVKRLGIFCPTCLGTFSPSHHFCPSMRPSHPFHA